LDADMPRSLVLSYLKRRDQFLQFTSWEYSPLLSQGWALYDSDGGFRKDVAGSCWTQGRDNGKNRSPQT